MNKSNGIVTIDPIYVDRIEQRITFRNNAPDLIIFDTQTNQELFVIRVIPSNITIESQAPYQMITMS
jgi:hypothetical protein